jgi:rubrerythrin
MNEHYIGGLKVRSAPLKENYQCKNCGTWIKDSGINAPCPRCGWRGSRPVKTASFEKAKIDEQGGFL